MQTVIDVEFIKLKAKAADTGHLKLPTWGTKEQLINVLIDSCEDRYKNNDINK